MASFLNINLLTFLCVTALAVLGVRANAVVPDQELKLDSYEVVRVTINKIFDDVLPMIKDIIKKKGLDPMKMPDIQKELNILGVKGMLNLKKGSMQGLSQLKRFGDMTVIYKDKTVTVDALLGLDIIDVTYDYQFKYSIVMRLGALSARVSDMKLRAVLKIDLERYRISLKSFQTISVREIDVKLKGDVIDDILTAAINAFIGSFKKKIIETVDNKGSEVIRKHLDKINELIPRPDRTPQEIDMDIAVLGNSTDWDNMVDNIPTHIQFVIV